jgi:uncharacterized protein YbaR (Trm112 family)
MSSLDPVLLEVLACPCEHHAAVEVDADPPSALICTRCRSSFPVRDGIPVMLLDDATPGPQGIGADLRA